MDVVFDPGEGDGSLSAALAEPEQEGARTLVSQQSLLPLLTDESHDAAAGGENKQTHVYRLNSPPTDSRSFTRASLTHRSRGTAGVF